MPIYERKCDKCGRIEEEFSKLPESVKTNKKVRKIKCQKHGCSGIMLRVEYSISSFQLKGKGWFKSGGY